MSVAFGGNPLFQYHLVTDDARQWRGEGLFREGIVPNKLLIQVPQNRNSIAFVPWRQAQHLLIASKTCGASPRMPL